jgi:hypothetical protein
VVLEAVQKRFRGVFWISLIVEDTDSSVLASSQLLQTAVMHRSSAEEECCTTDVSFGSCDAVLEL